MAKARGFSRFSVDLARGGQTALSVFPRGNDAIGGQAKRYLATSVKLHTNEEDVKARLMMQ